MYLRGAHAEASIPVLRELIRKYPLGVLTTAIRSKNFSLLQSSHIPWVLDVEDESSDTELGVLRGHIARMNPQSKAMIEQVTSQPDAGTDNNYLEEDVLILFTAATQHYVTPKFYVETKPATGKVVPTWNYAAVQAYGRARVYHDAKSPEAVAFLSKQIRDLSQHAEASVMGYDGAEGRPGAWQVSDAPDRYIELLRNAIIGIEIKIDRLEGKFKMSQEMGEGDRQGVIEGFRKMDSEVGRDVGELVKQRSDLMARSTKVSA